MRPDQHKKKKNAECKKKHGIPKQAKEKSQVGQRTDESAETSKRNEGIHSNSDSDDERKDEEERDHGGRQFSRRKIENNWDRYKEQDQDEEYQSNVPPTVSKIGADFQSLLDNTGGPSSHFHFKGEKEWENLNENYEMNSKVGSTIMSVDFEALAQALREIPLDRRLEIDKKYLEPEDELPCAKTMEVQKVKSPATNSVTAPMSANSKQTFSARNFNFSKPSELSQKTELKEKGGPVINDTIASSTTKIVQLGTNHTHIKETGRNHITEDLDQLLRLGTAEGKSDVEVIGKIPQNKENDQRHTQDTSRKMDESKEDLEDWLDSILD